MTTAQILRKAADLLDEKGWCRFKLEDARGRFCVLGALFDADASGYSINSAAWAMRFKHSRSMVQWNNHRARDKRTVTRRLRAAAKRLEAK